MKQNLSKRCKSILFVLIATALLACGCGEFTPEFDRASFESARQLWLEKNKQNYAFRQSYSCPKRSIAPKSTTLFVIDGIPKYFRKENPSGQICALDEYEFEGDRTFFGPGDFVRLSISEIYAEIERCANLNKYKISVGYNYSHVPSSITIEDSDKKWLYLGIPAVTPDPEIPELSP